VLWIVALFILATGYFGITHHYEQQIAASAQRAQTLYDKANLNRRLISQSGKGQRLRRELRARLEGTLFDAAASVVTAMLLRDLDTLARRHGTPITAIAPQAPPKVPAPVATTVPQLQNEAIDISARGHFSDLLAFVAQLPHQHILLRVSQVTFAVSGTSKLESNRPILDAKIHALVYRLTKPNGLGEL
jgi:hypothetical protein